MAGISGDVIHLTNEEQTILADTFFICGTKLLDENNIRRQYSMNYSKLQLSCT